MSEIAGDMHEGLLALAVGAGLQVMHTLMEENVTAVCGPKGKHDSGGDAVRHGGRVGRLGRAAGSDRAAADARGRRDW